MWIFAWNFLVLRFQWLYLSISPMFCDYGTKLRLNCSLLYFSDSNSKLFNERNPQYSNLCISYRRIKKRKKNITADSNLLLHMQNRRLGKRCVIVSFERENGCRDRCNVGGRKDRFILPNETTEGIMARVYSSLFAIWYIHYLCKPLSARTFHDYCRNIRYI